MNNGDGTRSSSRCRLLLCDKLNMNVTHNTALHYIRCLRFRTFSPSFFIIWLLYVNVSDKEL